MLDIWEDKDGNISIEARGMAPADERERKMQYIGFVDEKEGHFFGVYSEILGQVDSRAVSDDRLLFYKRGF